MVSQGSFNLEMKAEELMSEWCTKGKTGQMVIVVFEAGRGPEAKECGHPLS